VEFRSFAEAVRAAAAWHGRAVAGQREIWTRYGYIHGRSSPSSRGREDGEETTRLPLEGAYMAVIRWGSRWRGEEGRPDMFGGLTQAQALNRVYQASYPSTGSSSFCREDVVLVETGGGGGEGIEGDK
jgi:hypothetical protein